MDTDAPTSTVMATQETCCELITAELAEALQCFQDPTPACASPDFLEFQHDANSNLYLPLCDTCGEEQDAPIPLEGDGTGVQI